MIYFLQLICTGKYYEEWRNEPKRAKLYDSIFPTCMVLHLLMVSIIKIKKIKSDKSVQPQTKIIDEDEESADQKGNRKIVNFGSLIIALIILVPMLGNAYFLTLVENRLDPMKLNEPPVHLHHPLFPPYHIGIWSALLLLCQKPRIEEGCQRSLWILLKILVVYSQNRASIYD